MIPVPLYAEAPALPAGAEPRPPAIVTPAPREISFGLVQGRVFAGTTEVRVLVDGDVLRRRDVAGPAPFAFTLALPPRDVRIRVVALNGRGDRSSTAVGPVFGLPAAGRPEATRRSREDATLARRLRRLARGYGGTAAVYVQGLQSARGAAWNAGARFLAGSTLKAAIAVEVLRRETARPRPGSTLAGLLRQMLVVSDNRAANELLVRLGGSTSGGAAHVNTLMRSLGMQDSLMYGGYEVLTAGPRRIPVRVNEQPAIGVGKYTTAYDLARLHRAVNQAARGRGPLPRIAGSFGRRDARYLLWLLAHVDDHGKLDRLLPAHRTAVLHKAGWISRARHDAGVVYWRGGSYVAAVMTWNANGAGTSSDVLAGRVAERALDRFRALERARTTAPAGPGTTIPG